MRWNNKCNVDNKLENPTPYTCYIRQNWLVVKTPVICAGVLKHDFSKQLRIFPLFVQILVIAFKKVTSKVQTETKYSLKP